jgi:hypothetical protein
MPPFAVLEHHLMPKDRPTPDGISRSHAIRGRNEYKRLEKGMTAQERDAYHIVVLETEKWRLQALHVRVTLIVIDIRTNCYHSPCAKVIHGSEALFINNRRWPKADVIAHTRDR